MHTPESLLKGTSGKTQKRSIKKLEGLIQKAEKEGHAGLWISYRGKLREYREGMVCWHKAQNTGIDVALVSHGVARNMRKQQAGPSRGIVVQIPVRRQALRKVASAHLGI